VGHDVSAFEPPRAVEWLLRRVTDPQLTEALVGDLVEEYRATVASGAAAPRSRWYWREVARAAPALLWSALRRRRSPGAFMAAAAAYLVVAGGVFGADWLTARAFAARPPVHAIASFTSFVAVLMFGGWLAATLRRGAAGPLAVAVFVMSAVALVRMAEPTPVWYQLAVLLTAPLSALAGARLRA
jgi:hypothetical protein